MAYQFVVFAILVGMLAYSQNPPPMPELPSTLKNLEKNYRKALGDGLKTIPVAREFQKIFPGAINSYSYYTGEVGPTILNCRIGLYGRYELKFKVRVSLNETRKKVMDYTGADFYLAEIESINRLDDGRFYISYGNLHRRFGAKEWEKLFKARGDFTVLGIKLIMDKPVPNFEAWWEEEKERSRM